MAKVEASGSLSVRLEVEGQAHEFVLREGESLLIGRDKTCQVVIDDDSISSRHLEVRWHDKRIEIRDMDSSNGTFRMPQDAPFLEAKIELIQEGLDLRLSKIPLTLKWKLVDPFAGPKGISVEAKSVDQSVKTVPPQSVSKRQTKIKGDLSSKSGSESHLGPKFFWGFVLSSIIAVCVLSYSKVWPLLSMGPLALKSGLGFDLIEILFSQFSKWMAVVVCLAAVLFFLFSSAKKKVPSQVSISTSKLSLLVGALIVLLPFASPFLVMAQMGSPAQKFEDYRVLQQVYSLVRKHDYSSREENMKVSKLLKSFDKTYFGSSIFYSVVYNFQKQRAVNECEGLGDSAWDKKRFCLVLLYALSLESYAVVRPLYYYETSATLVLLASLDGIVRVLAAEGSGSEYLELFLKSLDKVGLNSELLTLQRFVKSFKGKSFDELMGALLDLRLSLEKRVFRLQNENAFPAKYALDLRGPLEMGI